MAFDDAEREGTALWKLLPKVVFSTTLSEVQRNARQDSARRTYSPGTRPTPRALPAEHHVEAGQRELQARLGEAARLLRQLVAVEPSRYRVGVGNDNQLDDVVTPARWRACPTAG
jgi:hypothetical protein